MNTTAMIMVAGLIILSITLFVAARLRWIHDSTLQTIANISGIVALVIAIATFALPGIPQPPPSVPTSTPASTQVVNATPTLAPSPMPITITKPLTLALNLASPFVDGLQLKVTKIENADGIIKVEVKAQYHVITLEPLGPFSNQNDYSQEKAESEEQQWRTLQSSEFTFKDQADHIYTVDAARSDWDHKVTPDGSFSGFMTLSKKLEPSVSQLSLIYDDVDHGKRGVVLTIDGIPVPRAGGVTTQSQQDNPIAKCGFITSKPQLTDEVRRKVPRFASCFERKSNINHEQILGHVIPISPTLTIPTPGTWTVYGQSNEMCGLVLKAQSVSRDECGITTFTMTLANNDLPYNLSLASLPLNVTGLQSVTNDLSDKIRSKGDHSFHIILYDLPPGTKEISVSLTLPAKQVLTIEHIPLP
ncbi:MAG: hypothetical protein U0350_00125 [Caldilineaceae bacterium]